MRFASYLASAGHIISAYQGQVPLAAWLKNYFSQHKKYGSGDRRWIADLCYCYFRLGKAFVTLSTEERLLTAQFLCYSNSPFIAALKPEWQHKQNASLPDKLSFLGEKEWIHLFPFRQEISTAIEQEPFVLSFLQQPDLFLRIRPGKEKTVITKLTTAGIPFEQEGDCLRLPNSAKVDAILTINEEAVVQDYSSQQVLQPLQQHLLTAKPQTTAWDCCAASGGKTILLHDAYPPLKLTVTDIRESILVNLRNRLKKAGIQGYRSFVADVAAPGFSLQHTFHIVLCDAPCSGSGTWGRTPEQLCFFSAEKIAHYVSLQKSIALNASRSLKKGGYFLYFTCSVFARENEEVVSFLQEQGGMQVLSQHYFKGYEKKADTLFAALFTAG